MSLTLEQKLQQKLSPQQIQEIRLLEIPVTDLVQRINEELQANPALDEAPDLKENDTDNNEEWNDEHEDEALDNKQRDDSYDDYVNDDNDDYTEPARTGASDSRDIPFSVGTGLGEYLKSQVYLTKMDKPDRHIAKFIVGNIDENGYLRRSAEQMIDDLYFHEGLVVEQSRMDDIIHQIQDFDPSGVGATNLQECLLIQLRHKEQTPSVQLAARMLKHAFSDFSHRRFNAIKERWELNEEDIRDAVTEVTRLNPKPGSAWNGTVYERHQTFVIPDFYVEQQDGQLILSLNNGDIPRLRINRRYQEMMEDMSKAGDKQSAKTKEAARFVKTKLDAAQGFINALETRRQILLKTMTAIMNAQKDFFLEGDETCLKPLILQDIANKAGCDVSTVSRVSNSKYVQTEWGLFPLKFFFSEKMTNSSGEEVSTREIKTILREQIEAEDKRHPLTDTELLAVLRQKGYELARRTVAKYRDQLGIPVARLRRTWQA